MLINLLVLVVLLPALGAVAALVSGARLTRAVAATVAGVTAVLAAAAVRDGLGTAVRLDVTTLPWLGAGAHAPALGVLLDPLGSVLLLVVTFIGFLTVVFSSRYLSERNREHPTSSSDHPRFFFWLLAFLASMTGVALAPNFLQLFMFWEMTTVCSWVLIGFYRSERSLRAGFKALVMTHVGGLFFLAAVLVLFAVTGSVEFDALVRLPERLRTVVFLMIMAAAWAKSAQVPVHTWLPDAMEAPTPVSAYLHAAAMVKAGVFLVARTVGATWAMPATAAWILGVMALVTLFVALSYYFVQDDLKRLLAYSTIAHLSYVLLGVALGALGSLTAFRGGVLHIACHAFAKGTLFFCAGAVAYITGTRSISALGGLARTMPLTAAAFFVGVLATTGVPPFACFWSKLMILGGAIQLAGAAGPVVVVLVLTESLISFAWMVHVGQKIFLGAVTPAAAVNSDPPPAMSGVLVALMVGCLVIPALVLPLVEAIGR